MLNFQLEANITRIVIGTVLSNFTVFQEYTLYTSNFNLSFFHKFGVSVLPFYSKGMC